MGEKKEKETKKDEEIGKTLEKASMIIKEQQVNGQKKKLGVTSLIIALAACVSAILCSWILSDNIVQVFEIRERDRAIKATGSARIRVKSDLVVWRAVITARGDTLADAWSTLSKSTPRVKQYLIDHKIPESDFVINAVNTNVLHPRNDDGFEIYEKIIGYDLTQDVLITSKNIDLVTDVSRQVTELIEEGIEIESGPPSYLYTGMEELKIRLVSAAAEDARTRAEQIAEANHTKIIGLSSARMGVVQVNAANETRVTWDGVNDRGSIDKDAFVVVSSLYYVE